jgi:phosphatidylglycerophosphate synthase
MAEYQPAWRRPIAQTFRRTADGAVRWSVRRGVHPNLISCVSIVVSAAGSLCFWQAGRLPALLIPAAGFCYLRLWFNMLDGMVALAAGKASRIGEIANELPDRISDVLIFVAVAHSGLCRPLFGYWVALLALLVAYVGTLGQAIGVQREFSGWMAKPWRMVALHLGAWATLGFMWSGAGMIRYRSLTVLDWTLLTIIAGCVQTVAIRLARILTVLQREGPRLATQQVPEE